MGLPQFPQNLTPSPNSLPQLPQYLCCTVTSLSAAGQPVQEAPSELEHEPSYSGEYGNDED